MQEVPFSCISYFRCFTPFSMVSKTLCSLKKLCICTLHITKTTQRATITFLVSVTLPIGSSSNSLNSKMKQDNIYECHILSYSKYSCKCIIFVHKRKFIAHTVLAHIQFLVHTKEYCETICERTERKHCKFMTLRHAQRAFFAWILICTSNWKKHRLLQKYFSQSHEHRETTASIRYKCKTA